MLSALLSLAALPLAVQATVFKDTKNVRRDGIVQFPVKTIRNTQEIQNLLPRQFNADLKYRAPVFIYSIDVTIGTPGQTVPVVFDTGSTELWVNPSCANATVPDYCEQFKQFTSSSSLQDLEAEGGTRYGTGFAYWDYYQDFVTIGDAKISQQVFGVAYSTDFTSFGIMGLAPPTTGWEGDYYDFVVDSLAKQEFIESRAFSVDLRSAEDARGAVTFGGIDTKKYSGSLEKRPILAPEEAPDGNLRFWIYMDGMTISQTDGSTTNVFSEANGQAVFVDSGTTITALPASIADKVTANFPTAQKIPGSNQYSVDCSVANRKGSVNFVFGETSIKVPFADIILEDDSTGTCILGVVADDAGAPVLGETFMRAAYVVFDWDNRNLHIANNEDCGSNLVKIGTGADSVPSLVGECGAKPTTTTTTAKPTTTTTKDTTTEVTTTEAPTSAGNSTTKAPTTTAYPTTTGYHNGTTSHGGQPSTYPSPTYVTSTVTTSHVYTITSCPPTVTDCPVGSVTTEVVEVTTTFCPATETTKVFHPQTSCSQTTKTVHLPPAHTCTIGMTSCELPPATSCPVVTVVPVPTTTTITVVPGCTTCGANNPPPAPTSPSSAYTTVVMPTPPPAPCTTCNGTGPNPPPPVTAGAAQMWQMSGAAALFAGAAAVFAF